MSERRNIARIIEGRESMDGAGVRLTRVFGHADVRDFDPFLLLDAFDSTNPDEYVRGFPWHPHRGIETVTYLIEGDIEHGDSLDNKGSIRDGDCQWMTAGSGIIHQEMPQPTKRLFGAQLWLNLPEKDKMTTPRYGDISSEDIPEVEHDGVRVRVIAGTYRDTRGAFEGAHIRATYLDVEALPGHGWSIATERGATVFAYILRGEGQFDGKGEPASEKRTVLFDDGDTVVVQALSKGVRFLFLVAQPLKEPIAWGGPIVMNTQEELDVAFREIDLGTFIRR